MQPWIGGRQITSSSLAVSHQLSVTDLNRDAGADGVAIALDPLQLQPQPMIGSRGFIVQEDGRLAVIAEGQVHSAVVIIIAGGQAAADMSLLKIVARLFRNMLEVSLAVVEKHLRLLAKGIVRVTVLVDDFGDMTVAKDDVQRSVVVNVE